MTEFQDRILVFIIIATGLTGFFGWGSSILQEYSEPFRYLLQGLLLVLYFAVLVGVWEVFKRIDSSAPE